jgi:hypothetical protein
MITCRTCEHFEPGHKKCEDCRLNKVKEFEKNLIEAMNKCDLEGALRIPQDITVDYVMNSLYAFSNASIDLATFLERAYKEGLAEQLNKFKSEWLANWAKKNASAASEK